MRRRILATLLAALMLCALLPVTALADENDGPAADDVIEIVTTPRQGGASTTAYYNAEEFYRYLADAEYEIGDSKNFTTITLLNDVTANMEDGSGFAMLQAVLDLNGYTLTIAGEGGDESYGLFPTYGCTIKNGTISVTAPLGALFVNIGAHELLVENVIVKAEEPITYGIAFALGQANSLMTFSNCVMNENIGTFCLGTGTPSEKTKGVLLESGHYAGVPDDLPNYVRTGSPVTGLTDIKAGTKVYSSDATTAIIVKDGDAYLYDSLQDAVDAAAGQEEVTIQLVKQPEDAVVVPAGLDVTLEGLDNSINVDRVSLLAVAGGSGTADDPYQIADVDQLKDFRDAVNAGNSFADTYFKLTGTEYDLSGAEWTPIGSYGGTSFSGHFDGAGRTISGMTIVGEKSDGYLGFFGSLSGAEVKGLTLSDASITCAEDCWAGVLAGYAGNSVITDCHAGGTITTGGQAVGSGQTGNHGVAVGGLVEYAYKTAISSSSSDVDITISSGDALAYAGGIVCEANGATLTECSNTGDISACSTLNGGNSYVGGIAAYIKNGSTVSGCENTGAVSSGDENSAYYAAAGGILGAIWNETPNAANSVIGSTNSGAVSAAAQDGASYAGGIVGESYQYTQRYENGAWQPLEQTDRGDVTISGCTNSGAVTGAAAAGVLGWGDAEWKLIFTGNSGGPLPQMGYFDLPAKMTFGGEDGYEFTAYANYLTAIQTIHIAEDLPNADLTVEDGQALIIEAGVAFTGDITLEPGGTLINYGTIEEGAAAPAGEYLVTFRDRDTVLAQVATSGGKVTRFPADPTRSGYTFAGWQLTDGTAFTAESTVTENTDVTARWNVISSGGGASVTRYAVSVPGSTAHGKVTASSSQAAYNQTVTITVTPDEGYELDVLTVTDADGKALALTDKGDGKYTFAMPRGKVWVSASFKPVEEASRPLPFTDVAEGAWYYDAVVYAYENGLMDGTSASTFAPGVTTDRAMLATLLYRLEGRPAVSGGLPFDDVAGGTWYTDAVIWAAAEDIVNGVGDGASFAPAAAITREQMAVMLYRYAKYKGYDVTRGGMAAREYADYDQVSGWAESAVQWAVNAGLITGTSATTLSPQDSATRAEIAAVLMRFCQNFVIE